MFWLEAKAAQEEGGATKNVKDPKDQSAKLKKAAEANDIPEDVLAVLQASLSETCMFSHVH